jgi:uncharacterized protein (TIGR03083 family)
LIWIGVCGKSRAENATADSAPKLAEYRLGASVVVGQDLSMQNYLTQLNAAADRFAQILNEGDLEAPVPPCPEWRLADLADHLGEVHQWATHAVVAGNPDADTTSAPKDRADLVDWYREAAGTLLTTLQTTDPAAPAWTFGPKPRTASFWHRRQLHETIVHLWDAAASQGISAPIDGAVARDGIDEVLTMFFPRQVRLARIPPLQHALALSADDAGAEQRWVLAGTGVDEASAPDAPAQATVSGPAEALLLLLWGRVGLDDPRLRLDGDEAAARDVLSSNITP